MVARNGTTALRKRGSTTAECKVDHSTSKKDENATSNTKSRSSGGETKWRVTLLRLMTVLLLVVLVMRASLDNIKSNHTSTLLTPPISISTPRQKRARFPIYGTQEFNQQCNWTLPSTPNDEQKNPPCSLLVRPPVRSNEGIADWVSQITRAYMQARQVGCKVIFDYGVDVDIAQVLHPFSNAPLYNNWTVPSNIECNKACQNSISFRFGDWPAKAVKKVPYYRHMFTYHHDWLYKGEYDYMPQVLPGFDIQTGMACALGSLLQLSPAASQFEPNLFTTILPALHDDHALVIALYMRTNRADVMAINEKRNESVAQEKRGKYNSVTESFAKIAHCLEEQYLSKSGNDNNNNNNNMTNNTVEANATIDKVYWIVLSDSPEAKKTVIENYSNMNANKRIPVENQKYASQVIPRRVLATGARGIHVRAERNPSTSEFAEAFLDWYLIGESDALVTDMSSSFGPTGALRTNRPIYRIGGKCQKLRLIHDVSEKDVKKVATKSIKRGKNGERVVVTN